MASFQEPFTAEQQTKSLLKAAGNKETPTKMKHVRKIVLGSFQEQGCGTFWAAVRRLPLKTSKVTCWKFCHVLHKLLRDGHPHVLHDSLKYIVDLDELGRFWEGHLDSYGMLAAHYCKLLVRRLTFHQKHPKLPGSLRVTHENISESTANDANGYFEFAVEVLDLMDELLSLQTAVLQSLDHSRASIEESGQCRLYPLILCIQDSCHLYNCLVKLLFRLHHALLPHMLDGHRERFNSQFNRLRQFYQTCANLQYYKNLVQVPSLPDKPPNFLVASDKSRHHQLVAIVSDEDVKKDDETVTPIMAPLIDLSLLPTASSPMPRPLTPTKSVRPPSTKDETLMVMDNGTAQCATIPRDAVEAEFKQQIHHLQNELEFVNTKANERIAELQKTTTDLTARLEAASKSAELNRMDGAAIKNSLDATVKECTQLRAQLQAFKDGEDAASRLANAERAMKESQQLKKLKDIYGQLREEHIALLRTHAEVKKQQEADNQVAVQVNEALQRNVQELQQLQCENAELRVALQLSSDRVSMEAAELHQRLAEAVQQRESFAEQLRSATNVAADSRTEASKAETERSGLAMRLNEALSRQHAATERATLLQKQLGTARDEAQKLGAELARLAEQLEATTKQAADSRSAASQAETERLSLMRQLEEALSGQRDVTEEARLLRQQFAAERREAQESAVALSRTKSELEQLKCDYATLQVSFNGATSEAAELKQQLADTKKQHQDLATKFEAVQNEAAHWKSTAETTRPKTLGEDATWACTEAQDSFKPLSVND